MHKEVKELYFADDGTPFEENKEACEVYDTLYYKLYKMIEHGKVLFWNYSGKFVRDQLLNHKWNTVDKLCYYDWLKEQLFNVAYFRITVANGTTEFAEVWDLLSGLLNLNTSQDSILYNNYRTGDLCKFDYTSDRYVNQDDIIRGWSYVKETLGSMVPEEFKKFIEVTK